MTFLIRVLKVQAAVWVVFGVALAITPAGVLRLIDQTVPRDGAWIRLLGVCAVVLALYMVLVAQHAVQTWWWAWGFVVLEAGVATVAIINAIAGVPTGLPAWPWWTLGIVSIAFGALDLLGIVQAEHEKPVT